MWCSSPEWRGGGGRVGSGRGAAGDEEEGAAPAAAEAWTSGDEEGAPAAAAWTSGCCCGVAASSRIERPRRRVEAVVGAEQVPPMAPTAFPGFPIQAESPSARPQKVDIDFLPLVTTNSRPPIVAFGVERMTLTLETKPVPILMSTTLSLVSQTWLIVGSLFVVGVLSRSG